MAFVLIAFFFSQHVNYNKTMHLAIIESLTQNFAIGNQALIHYHQYTVDKEVLQNLLSWLSSEFTCKYCTTSVDNLFTKDGIAELMLVHQNYLMLQIGLVTLALFETQRSKALAEEFLMSVSSRLRGV